MKKINKKVLKVVERVIRNEIKRASGDHGDHSRLSALLLVFSYIL